jgi:hypothetical protein
VAKIEPIGEKGIFLRVMVPVNVLTIADDIRVLQVLQRAPKRSSRTPSSSRRAWRSTSRCCSRA